MCKGRCKLSLFALKSINFRRLNLQKWIYNWFWIGNFLNNRRPCAQLNHFNIVEQNYSSMSNLTKKAPELHVHIIKIGNQIKMCYTISCSHIHASLRIEAGKKSTLFLICCCWKIRNEMCLSVCKRGGESSISIKTTTVQLIFTISIWNCLWKFNCIL